MSKSKQQFWLIIIILTYIVIAILGFFTVFLIRNAFHATKQPIQTQTVTRNWKTYENRAYKLRLSYPPEETIKTSSIGFGVTNVEMQTKNSIDFHLLLLPKTLAQMVGQNFDVYYSMPDHTTTLIKNPLANDNTKENFTKIKNRIIADKRAFEYQSVSANNPKGSPEIGVFIESGNNLILISTRATNRGKLEQMLQSIQL